MKIIYECIKMFECNNIVGIVTTFLVYNKIFDSNDHCIFVYICMYTMLCVCNLLYIIHYIGSPVNMMDVFDSSHTCPNYQCFLVRYILYNYILAHCTSSQSLTFSMAEWEISSIPQMNLNVLRRFRRRHYHCCY